MGSVDLDTILTVGKAIIVVGKVAGILLGAVVDIVGALS